MLLKFLFLFHAGICLASPSKRSLTNSAREKLIEKTKVSSYEILLHEWESFKHKYNKVYNSTDVHLQRFNIYADNVKLIEEHNDLYNKGVVTYSLEMNHFGDWTAEERKRLLGYKNSGIIPKNTSYLVLPSHKVLQKEIDWRKLGAVTEIKNQGYCGSCWAFSATGALEGQYFRKNKVLVSLSEQNLIDCDRDMGNEGCEGGFSNMAFKYIELNGGIDTEESYPYEAYDGECRYNKKYTAATTRGFSTVPADERSLQKAVAAYGPISVAIDAGGYGFSFYKRGIFYNATCSQDYEELNHAVLLVGYGHSNNSGDYWLVKNSWGEDWGDNGYIQIARNRDNNCGITVDASLPMV